MSQKVKKRVPKLRFPEFVHDWEHLTIEEIASVSSGGTPSRSEPSFWNGDIPWITTSEISQAEIFDANEKITQKGLENSSAKIFKKNTLLIAMYGQGKTRGQVAILRIEATTNQACAAVILKNNYNPEFIYYFLFKEYENLRKLSNDGSQQNLSAGLIKQYKVSVTQFAEQEKIASFLGAVDARLTQLRRKRDRLQTYKRGVMQKIFSQEMRFRDAIGSPFPDWQEKTLGEIAKVKRGASPRPISSPKWFSTQSKIGWVRISDVTKSNKYLEETEQYLSEFGIEKSRFVLSGNLIMSICATIGKPIITNIDVCIHDGFVIFENLQASILFVYFLLEHIEIGWKRYGQPGIQLNLNTDIVSNEPVFLPCLEEQEKIVNFLTAIDRKIEAISRQLDRTEQFKKGLLQKMFV